ncbi:MAG TPA: YtxH domain-containing protein [Anaerolineales bacterium]|nr:YtxH domain-containing protein [Anaerolineales bacterium]
MRRVFSFLLGTASGALVGATLAILLTPASGADLRSELRHRVTKFLGELEEAAQQRRAELERQLEAMRHPGAEIPLEDR